MVSSTERFHSILNSLVDSDELGQNSLRVYKKRGGKNKNYELAITKMSKNFKTYKTRNMEYTHYQNRLSYMQALMVLEQYLRHGKIVKITKLSI